MKKRQHEVFILLGALIALSFGIGLLHGDEKNSNDQSLLEQPDVKTIEQLEPLIEARSVEKIAKSLSILPMNHIEGILKKIIHENNIILTRNDKIELIAALSTEFERDPQYANYFFSFLSRYPRLIVHGEPVLYVLARAYYDPQIPRFLKWLTKYQPISGIPSVSTLLDQAGNYAIKQHASGGGQRLFSRNLGFTKEQLNKYLWQLTFANGNAKLVPPLAKSGADLNTHFFGTTPLFNAVKNNNFAMVEALLKAGANVNYIADKSYGSPLQEALAKNLTQMELLLRAAGARE